MDGYNLSMSDRIEENPRDKLYIWLSDKTNGKKYLVEGNKFLFIREWMREGGYSDQNKDKQKEKISCKGNEGVYLVSHVIDGEIWLHDLGKLDASYHSDT